MLRVDGSPGFGCCCSDLVGQTAGLFGRDEARQPPIAKAADAAKFARREPSQPDFGRRLRGFRPDRHIVEVVEATVVAHRVFAPQPPDDGKCLVEHRCAVFALDRERSLFAGVGNPEAKSGEQPATR